MNYLDIIILIPVLCGLFKGFSKGFIIEVAGLIALILGIWCANCFSEYTADILINKLNFDIAENYLPITSFSITFIVVAVVIILISHVADKFLSAIALGGVVKILGALFGAAKYLLVISIIVYFVNGIDSKMEFLDRDKKENSMLYLPLVNTVDKWIPELDFSKIKEKVPENLQI